MRPGSQSKRAKRVPAGQSGDAGAGVDMTAAESDPARAVAPPPAFPARPAPRSGAGDAAAAPAPPGAGARAVAARPEAPAGAATVPARRPEPGLHIVATPIGAARDITLRALDVLASADLLAAEDTRSLRHLMQIHAIPLAGRRIVALHDHSGPGALTPLLEALAAGRTVAYASEAGTPMVADPGLELVRAAIEAGLPVHTAPGPSAVLAALTLAGLPTDRFLFLGFPPRKPGDFARWATGIEALPATLVMFEAPGRVNQTLTRLAEILGQSRRAVLCRELTKRFEEVRRGTLGTLAGSTREEAMRGECVILIDRPDPPSAARADAAAIDAALAAARAGGERLAEAAGRIARDHGLARRTVYARALELGWQG
jgi:16S rRNA (cytidine1402-2'-O)-methyltransferase